MWAANALSQPRQPLLRFLRRRPEAEARCRLCKGDLPTPTRIGGLEAVEEFEEAAGGFPENNLPTP
jgi:hypothetical protein